MSYAVFCLKKKTKMCSGSGMPGKRTAFGNGNSAMTLGRSTMEDIPRASASAAGRRAFGAPAVKRRRPPANDDAAVLESGRGFTARRGLVEIGHLPARLAD